MSRVTGLSLVDNQYVFVRGLGERYSNTTLAGSVLPTTEPDKKVVPLDLFPDRPDRQRAGEQVVLARSVGGVRGRSGPDRADQAPDRSRWSISRTASAYFSTATGKEHSAQPARQSRRLGLRRRRTRAAGGHPRQQDRASGHLHAGRRVHAGPDHRVRKIARQPVAAGRRERQAGAELERHVRQPVRATSVSSPA